MIEKTRGIVLRYAPVSNTSRAVTWLTEDFGRLTTLVKGSQRPKSSFIGQYDLFYTCELVFYARSNDRLAITRECTPLRTRPAFRSDWKSAALASWSADLVYRTAHPHAPDPGLFHLFETALDYLADEAGGLPALFWFELKLLETQGLAPRLVHPEAGPRSRPPRGKNTFSAAHGGVVSQKTVEGGSQTATPIRNDSLAILNAWLRADDPNTARRTRCTPAQLKHIEGLLGGFLAYHLDIPLTARNIALDVHARKVA